MSGAHGRFPSGLVEGFYGRPWSHSDRVSMIRFLDENGFNTYIYAPKDDPYQKSMWLRAYPRRQMEGLRELIRVAGPCSVNFVFTLSPGLDFSIRARVTGGSS